MEYLIMKCEDCNSELLNTTKCEEMKYCPTCDKPVGDCTKKCECGRELSKSSSGENFLCKECGKMVVAKEKEDQPEEEKSYPSIMEQAGNLLHESVEFAKSGFQTLNEDEFHRRIDICRACPAFDADQGRCKECGCFMKVKAKMETAKCPLNKWEE